MSNIVSDKLHRLIHSLTKPEKRYFKIYTSRHVLGDSNNYQKLFDGIDKMENYNEDLIRKRFSKYAFVNQLSIAKSRLYDQILNSLDAYYANSSMAAQLRRNLHCVEILYKKSLYEQSQKLLQSTKKLAEKFEKHAILLEIYIWEKRLLEKDNYTETCEEEITKMMTHERLIIEKIKNYNEFWNIKSRLFIILNKKGKARSQEELTNFKNIIDNVLLKKESEALYDETKYLYHHIYSAYYFSVGDYENSYIHLLKNIEFIENNIDHFKDEPSIYFSVLTNVIYVGSRLKNYATVFIHLEKLKSLPEKFALQSNEDLAIKLFSSTHSIELTLYAMRGEFDKGIELVPVIEDGLRSYGDKINEVRRAYLFFNISLMYFGEKKYSESLKWINRLLNDVNIEKSEDIHCFAQLLNLIIHLELGNQRLIPYALKSTQRYLTTRNRVYKFETIVMNHINRVLKLKEEDDEKLIYSRLMEELKPLQEDPMEKSAFEYFDLSSWVESKLTGKSFSEIVREKAK